MIGVVSDMHFKSHLSHCELIEDKRNEERENVLNEIVETFSGCGSIVILGDSFDKRHNPSGVVKSFVKFLEKFENKNIFIVAGNHEKSPDGKESAIGFLAELKNKPNWNIIVEGPTKLLIEGHEAVFLPYLHKSELMTSDLEEATERLNSLVERIGNCEALFAHHCISGTVDEMKREVETFWEPFLNSERLLKSYGRIFGGHIHNFQDYGNVHVVGSTFSNEMNESPKRVLILDENDGFRPTSIPISSGRILAALENPNGDENVPKNSIVRALFTDKEKNTEDVRKWLEGFDGHEIIERYEIPRKKTSVSEGFERLPIEKMLREYAKAKNVSYQQLSRGYELIKE